jgi:hypothetical protein
VAGAPWGSSGGGEPLRFGVCGVRLVETWQGCGPGLGHRHEDIQGDWPQKASEWRKGPGPGQNAQKHL